jgi:hypothetical protein
MNKRAEPSPAVPDGSSTTGLKFFMLNWKISTGGIIFANQSIELCQSQHSTMNLCTPTLERSLMYLARQPTLNTSSLQTGCLSYSLKNGILRFRRTKTQLTSWNVYWGFTKLGKK